MHSVGHFRSSVWDPCLIIGQIIALQCIFYSSLTFWIFLMDALVGSPKSLDQMFKYNSIYVRDLGGKKMVVVFLMNSLFCAVALWFLVHRAKQCLDFASTMHFCHLVLSWVYNGAFPSVISWWILNASCIIVTTVLGEYLCLQSELKAIPVSLGPTADL